MHNFWFAVFSGIGGVIVSGVFNHFHNNHKLYNHKIRKTITSVMEIEHISSDFKHLCCCKQVSKHDESQNSYDLTQLNLISLHVLSGMLNKHLLFSFTENDLTFILDFLKISYKNHLLTNYSHVIINYERAYKKIFQFHKKVDKYEISFK